MPENDGSTPDFDAAGDCTYASSGDLGYLALLSHLASPEYREELRSDFDVGDWDLPLETSSPLLSGTQMTPERHLLGALHLIREGSLSGDEFLEQAYAYVIEKTPGLSPFCNVRLRGSNPAGDEDVLISTDMLSRLGPIQSAGTVVHEIVHEDVGHNAVAADCGSCDQNFEDWGANSIHIVWMVKFADWDYGRSPRSFPTSDDPYILAVQLATSLLDSRFIEDPGWRPVDVIANTVILPLDQQYLTDIDPRREFSVRDLGDDLDVGALPEIGGVFSTDTIPYQPAAAACYLTRVRGKFQSADDMAIVRARPDLNSWELEAQHGGADDQLVAASARCVSANEVVTGRRVHPGGHWSGGPLSFAKVLKRADGSDLDPAEWGCFISEMSGKFRGSQSYIELTGDSYWNIDLRTDQEEGLTGGATCFRIDPSAGYVEFDSTVEDVSDNTPEPVEPGLATVGPYGPSRVCGFHKIRGFFDGRDEWVRMYPDGPLGDLTVSGREAVRWSFAKDWGKANATGLSTGPQAVVRCYTVPW